MPVYVNGILQDTSGGQWYGKSSAPGGFGGTYMGPSPFANAGTSQANPYLGDASSASVSGGSGGGIPTANVPHPDMLPRVGAPAISNFQYSQSATDYPTWMRNLGENQAQQSFQTATNQGVQAGNSVQGYQHAMDARNNARLGYMAQAGQEQNKVETNQANQQNTFNNALNQQFGINTTQRGQDAGMVDNLFAGDVAQRGQGLNYLVGMANAANGSRSGGVSVGGGAGSTGSVGSFIDINGVKHTPGDNTGINYNGGMTAQSRYSSDGTAAGLGYDPSNPSIYQGSFSGNGMLQSYQNPSYPNSALYGM